MPEAQHSGRPPAPGSAALLIIDMINPFDFEGAVDIAGKAVEASKVIAGLRNDADAAGAPVVYVNDNYGHWHSDQGRIVEHCRRGSAAAADVIARIHPRPDDYFIIKPQFSGFYAINLPVLLPKIGVSRLVLTGVAGDICVLFTAADAHMRDYQLWAPCDAIASEQEERNCWALDIMRKSMAADVRSTRALTLQAWLSRNCR